MGGRGCMGDIMCIVGDFVAWDAETTNQELLQERDAKSRTVAVSIVFTMGSNRSGQLGLGPSPVYSTWWVDTSKKFGDSDPDVVAAPLQRRGSGISTATKAHELLMLVQSKVRSSRCHTGTSHARPRLAGCLQVLVLLSSLQDDLSTLDRC